ncbi:coxsackievirus and adenovirus receptor [Limosa lapponica baueri]|uniref:Coxsackievirus and adenovirus receptor n=1 Tax=Limosa lapponica baueri TaxID=1758121 RepID=A0A2I0TDU2_LIMLA|nr:coxsackievirus and adenovirus receptor [Limosa lapponica baueri]
MVLETEVCQVKRFDQGLTRSLSITSVEQPMVEKAQGDKVTLPCTFVLSEEDEGPLDIEWVLIPADNQKKEQISFAVLMANLVAIKACKPIEVHIAESHKDKNTGELLLKNASEDYSGTYSCVASNRVGTDECSVELHVTPHCSLTLDYDSQKQLL